MKSDFEGAAQRQAVAHVVLNALLLTTSPTYRGAGINGYEHHLLRAMAALAEEPRVPGVAVRFTALVGDRRWHPPSGLHVHHTLWPTEHPLLRILWEQAVQPRVLHHLRADLVHSLAFVGPLWGPNIPQIVTVHDLSFVRFPETLPPWKARYLTWFTRRSVQRARWVITVSENTRQDVIQHFRVPPERVVSVPNGVESRFRPLPAGEVAAWRQGQRLPERFLLYLGTLQPRKNLEMLVDAYALWRRRAALADREIPLVLAGARGWYYERLLARVAVHGLEDHVLFPGYVPSEELPYWYNAATLFLYPSRFEGFGLPVLEAMACGTPVIAAHAASLPEVVGGAGRLVPPDDVAGWAATIGELLEDRTQCRALGEAGTAHARTFSWETTARRTLQVYARALGTAYA